MTIFEARARVLDIAKSYIGYTEKRTNSQLDDPTANAGSANWNRFARDVDACKGWMHGNKNGFEWCCMFYCGCFLYAFGYPIARIMLYQPEDSYAAKCSYALNYYKKSGALYSDPEPADQIFFDYGKGIAHTGMVSKVTDSYVYTIEGNSDNRVQEKKYARSNKIIAGYGRPLWSLVADMPAAEQPAPEQPKTYPTISKGANSPAVVELQQSLLELGYSLPRYGADGDFGAETERAVRDFQRANGLEVDGIVGPKTWGQIQKLKDALSDSAKDSSAQYITYTIKRGDALIGIARRYGTTAQELAILNGIQRPYTIYVGRTIKVPKI